MIPDNSRSTSCYSPIRPHLDSSYLLGFLLMKLHQFAPQIWLQVCDYEVLLKKHAEASQSFDMIGICGFCVSMVFEINLQSLISNFTISPLGIIQNAICSTMSNPLAIYYQNESFRNSTIFRLLMHNHAVTVSFPPSWCLKRCKITSMYGVSSGIGPCVGEDAPCATVGVDKRSCSVANLLRILRSISWCSLVCRVFAILQCNAPNSGRSTRFAIHVFFQLFKNWFEEATMQPVSTLHIFFHVGLTRYSSKDIWSTGFRYFQRLMTDTWTKSSNVYPSSAPNIFKDLKLRSHLKLRNIPGSRGTSYCTSRVCTFQKMPGTSTAMGMSTWITNTSSWKIRRTTANSSLIRHIMKYLPREDISRKWQVYVSRSYIKQANQTSSWKLHYIKNAF